MSLRFTPLFDFNISVVNGVVAGIAVQVFRNNFVCFASVFVVGGEYAEFSTVKGFVRKIVRNELAQFVVGEGSGFFLNGYCGFGNACLGLRIFRFAGTGFAAGNQGLRCQKRTRQEGKNALFYINLQSADEA